MKKYTTKPIDFTGCHPVIAEHLKRGEAIECLVWDNRKESGNLKFVVGYYTGKRYSYQCNDGMISSWMYAEPIPHKVRRIMPPERAIPVLIAEGWSFDDSGNLVGYKKNSILTTLFKLMGKPLSDTKVWDWPSCIIEEVEDDE